MRAPAITLGIVLCALIILTVAAFEGPKIAERMGMVEADPVLVFVIPDIDSAKRVNAAVPPERIVWRGDEGLALRGGRVISLDLDAAGDVIEYAGWVDRPIHIVRILALDSERDAKRDATSDEGRLARLRDLVNKPTLTRGEQVFVLQAMNDGLEI